MLAYQTICNVNRAQERIHRDSYNSRFYNTDGQSREGDEMTVFTFGKQAHEESKNNLQRCLTVARQYEQDLVIIKNNQIQIAGGTGSGRHELVANALFPRDWLREHNDWLDTTNPVRPSLHESRYGEFVDFYSWRHSLCMKEHQGVYDVATGQRLTNRRNVIERMWSIGFAANRGRPLTIAKPRWCGERDELKELTELADRYWTRRGQSEVAKKIVSAYTSTNRYYAWPGAW